jgi:hypothetical protein
VSCRYLTCSFPRGDGGISADVIRGENIKKGRDKRENMKEKGGKRTKKKGKVKFKE